MLPRQPAFFGQRRRDVEMVIGAANTEIWRGLESRLANQIQSAEA
jgi:hypothetical protein